jgi:hypothetical protein
MNFKFLPILVAGLLSAGPASAASITIDFESPASFASVGNYYSGQGVSFGLDALAIRNDELGPYFSNAPSPIGVMSAVGTDAAMNVAAGFYGSASFYYSSTAATSVGVYSGLNGTGALLGSFGLLSNAQANGCVDSPFCNWSLATLAFDGVAKSIMFGDAPNFAGFDDVNVNTVPLPAAWLLFSLGAAVLGFTARRRRAA